MVLFLAGLLSFCDRWMSAISCPLQQLLQRTSHKTTKLGENYNKTHVVCT